VGDYALPLDVVQSILLDQTAESVEGSSCFERADPLLVLALEEELHPWSCYTARRISSHSMLVWCRLSCSVGAGVWASFCLGCRSHLIDGLACCYRCSVDVGSNACVGLNYGLASEGWTS